MRTGCLKLSFVLAILLLFATGARADSDSLTFTLLPPSGNVTGVAGSTVGWGFVIANTSTSTDYLDINSIDSDLFLSANGSPDASVFLPPDLAPGDSITQPYDPIGQFGLFQFTWNPGVAVGTMESGSFNLYGGFCDPSDPFCVDDGDVSPVLLASAAYSATVMSASAPVGVPEPSSFLLLMTGLCAFGLWSWCRPHADRTHRSLS